MSTKHTINLYPAIFTKLELIERIWKFTKVKLRSKYYSLFSEFKYEIDEIIESTQLSSKDTITKLIGKGVQLLDNLTPISKNSFVDNRDIVS